MNHHNYVAAAIRPKQEMSVRTVHSFLLSTKSVEGCPSTRKNFFFGAVNHGRSSLPLIQLSTV